jgi:hypothetical protein
MPLSFAQRRASDRPLTIQKARQEPTMEPKLLDLKDALHEIATSFDIDPIDQNRYGVSDGYKYVLVNKSSGHCAHADRKIGVRKASQKQRKPRTVHALCAAIHKRLVLADPKSYGVKLVDPSGRHVDGRTLVSHAAVDAARSVHRNQIDNRIIECRWSIKHLFVQSNWKGNDWACQGREEFMYAFCSAFVRTAIEKLGKTEFRQVLKREGVI